MKIYCDPHFPLSLWLKCDPESPVVGLNWVSGRKDDADASCGMVKGLRCDYLKSFWGQICDFL